MEKKKYKKMSFPRNVVGNLPLSESLLKKEKQLYSMQKVEDPQQKPLGMTDFFHNGNSAFTLIELLVVVLIIGILAAVAVPQYQKAVIRARYKQAVMLGNAYSKAQQIYYMANGEYAPTFDDLSLDFPAPSRTASTSNYLYPWGSCNMSNERLQCWMNNGPWYQMSANGAASWCVAEVAKPLHQQICKAETGKTTYTTHGTTSYRYYQY